MRREGRERERRGRKGKRGMGKGGEEMYSSSTYF